MVTDTFRGNMQQQPHERFSSGSDRASAQAATRQQSVRNADVFTQRYPVSGPLQTSSADLDHRTAMFSAPSWNVRNAVSEYPYDHRGAMTMMTVTVQKYQDVTETRTVLAQNSFDTMYLLMLQPPIIQRYVNAEADPSRSDEIFSGVSNLIESARQNMSDRINNGEELSYNTLVGIPKHVDGRGQCFLHSRRILHGINDCPVVQRQRLLNQLIASPTLYLGLETAQQVMLKEQGIDVT